MYSIILYKMGRGKKQKAGTSDKGETKRAEKRSLQNNEIKYLICVE